MNILWFYKYIPEYNFDKWFHMEYARTIAKYPGVKLLAYGMDLEKGYADVATIPYDSKITMYDLKAMFPYDAVICNTKSRMFESYSPHTGVQKNCWIPSGFEEIKEPKIMIEEDYHYEKNDDWYKEKGFDLLLQRHHSQFLRKGKVPNAWLPFSVDTEVFAPVSIDRVNKIAFVGSSVNTAYPDRNRAIQTLSNYDYIVNYRMIVDEGYINVLKKNIAFLSCSSIYDITAAKTFEIMSSGAVLLTDMFSGIDEIFPDGTCVKFKKDQSDLVSLAAKILADREFARGIAANGMAHIRKHHSNDVRTGQLLDIIRSIKK